MSGVEIVIFEKSEGERLGSWLRHHGIDPADVLDAAPDRDMVFIARDPDRRRISYLASRWQAGFDGGLNDAVVTFALLTEVRHVQLEAVPSPFPEGYCAAVRLARDGRLRFGAGVTSGSRD